MFFENKWKKDKNLALTTSSDQRLFYCLPHEVKKRLFTNYLYKDFLLKFTQFFRIKKPHTLNYYTWEDEIFSQFMLCLLQYLRPNFDLKFTMVVEVLDEVNEIFFVE